MKNKKIKKESKAIVIRYDRKKRVAEGGRGVHEPMNLLFQRIRKQGKKRKGPKKKKTLKKSTHAKNGLTLMRR